MTLAGSKRSFDLRFQNLDEFSTWKGKLRHSIDSSMGKLKGLGLSDYTDDVN